MASQRLYRGGAAEAEAEAEAVALRTAKARGRVILLLLHDTSDARTRQRRPPCIWTRAPVHLHLGKTWTQRFLANHPAHTDSRPRW
jgi:hypothetical protein